MLARKCKVLLVEDLKIAQRLAQLTLNQLNCQVEVACNGKEALKLSNEKHYELIFMDLGLPDIDGLTVTENIRKDEVINNKLFTPIIALSAHSNDEALNRSCLDVGIDDFLIKPLTIEEARRILIKFIKH